MAKVIITLKIMPSSPDVDLGVIEAKAKEAVTNYGGEVGKVEQEPIAFGLMALNIILVADESKGSTEELEKEIETFEDVNSVEVTDVRRALG